MVICLERDADLHMAQQIPLPVTVCCFSKIQIGFTFLVTAHMGSPGKWPLNGCVCVCVCIMSRPLVVIVCGRVYVTVRHPSVCLSYLSTTAAACGGFAAVGLAGSRY